MSKPIFVIQLPNATSDFVKNMSEKLTGRMEDYHVLVLGTEGTMIKEPKFQLFSDKEIEPIELEKLKEIISQ